MFSQLVQDLVQALQGLPHSAAVALLAAAPVVEVRGSIPVGWKLYGMPLPYVLLLSVVASVAAVAPVLLLFERVANWLADKPVLGGGVSWLVRRARSKERWIERWGSLALVFFVGVPLPGSGAWTGALIAAVFGLRFWPSLLYIAVGVLIQCAAVVLATHAGFELFLAFKT